MGAEIIKIQRGLELWDYLIFRGRLKNRQTTHPARVSGGYKNFYQKFYLVGFIVPSVSVLSICHWPLAASKWKLSGCCCISAHGKSPWV